MKGNAPSIVALPIPGDNLTTSFLDIYQNMASKPTEASIHGWSKKLIADPEFAGGTSTPSNPKIPAGDTYLGQFLAHELTFQLADGIGLPSLQLDCLYGAGPDRQPYLYWYSPQPGMYDKYTFRGVKLLLNAQQVNGETVAWDVMRLGTNGNYNNDRPPLALMADARNDRTYILTQIHCVWALFHNAVAQFLFEQSVAQSKKLTQRELFDATRKVVVECFRQVVVFDYLNKLIDLSVLENIWNLDNFIIFDATYTHSNGQSIPNQPALMPEFLQGAFRFGHSQIREFYFLEWDLNKPIFEQQFKRIFSTDANNKEDLRGFREYTHQRIDWRLFFDYGSKALLMPQQSKAIDGNIAFPMSKLPFLQSDNNNLIHRDATKGQKLASGIEYARVLKKFPNNFKAYTNGIPQNLEAAIQNIVGAVHEDAPLWLYVLLEAEHMQGGQKLGPLGERIVAEQFLWVLKYSMFQNKSLNNLNNDLAISNPDVARAILNGANTTRPITMVDVLRFAGFTYPETTV